MYYFFVYNEENISTILVVFWDTLVALTVDSNLQDNN